MSFQLDTPLLSRLAGGLNASVKGERELAELAQGLMPDLEFRMVLTRGGWHRSGGVVDAAYRRVSDAIHAWVEAQAGGQVETLVDKYQGLGYFATRLQGRTHYLTASTGSGAADFVQLEVEELQEVLDRPLLDPDWLPDDIEDLLDPMDYPRLEPEPIGAPRFLFRRVTRVRDLLADGQPQTGQAPPLARFFDDWERSSAGRSPLCGHWVLAIREPPDAEGASQVSVKPIPVQPPAEPVEVTSGADLANRLQAVDQQAGYGLAWYFSMLASQKVPFAAAEAVARDLAEGYEYLPAADAQVVLSWNKDKYAV